MHLIRVTNILKIYGKTYMLKDMWPCTHISRIVDKPPKAMQVNSFFIEKSAPHMVMHNITIKAAHVYFLGSKAPFLLLLMRHSSNFVFKFHLTIKNDAVIVYITI